MYKKQEWKDEIPDLTKPIMDPSTGKQKTDPQTGRPLFEVVQVGTRITSTRLNNMEGGIEAAHTLVEKLAKEMGGNFVAVVDDVMGLSCSAEGLKASWTAGVAYVGGRRYEVSAGEMALNPTQGQYLYVDVGGVVKKTTSQVTAKAGMLLFYVATDTSGVISSADQRVNLSLEEILKKIENVNIPDASLTVKGKTWLSSATNSTLEDRAATPKAVNDARVSAIADSKIYADNGFIKKATLIPNDADLNTYMTEGSYYCPTNLGAATLINSPARYACTLRVERHVGILQTLTTYQTSNFATYQRNYVLGGSPSPWGAWYKLPTSAEVLLAETNAKAYADVAIEQSNLWGAL